MGSQQVGQFPDAQPAFFYGKIVVVAALCIMAAMWDPYYAFSVFFNTVLTGFGWTRAIMSDALSLSTIVRPLLEIVIRDSPIGSVLE